MRISDWSSDVCSSDLKINTAPAGSDAVQFGWVREHLRVLSANTPTEAIGEYGRMQRAGKLSDAQRYGLAYAHLLAGHGAEAAKELATLLEKRPGDHWLMLARGQAKARRGVIARSTERRGGNGTVSTCRSRWSSDHYNKNNTSININA